MGSPLSHPAYKIDNIPKDSLDSDPRDLLFSSSLSLVCVFVCDIGNSYVLLSSFIEHDLSYLVSIR